MHSSTLLVSVSALLATTAVATPAPLEAPLTYPELAADDLTASLSLTARDFSTDDQGDLPNNVAKVWAFTQGRCDSNDGPSYMWTVLPGTDRCLPVKNIGSVYVWKLNNAGKGTCRVTLHSGSDCRGIQWTPRDRICAEQKYASIRVTCPIQKW